MPNWCNNYISIVGPREKVEQLWNRGPGLLENMVGGPKEGEDAYQWCVDNWGTKWDIGLQNDLDHNLKFTQSEDGEVGMITGAADTAWAPPIAAFEEYAQQNSDVEMVLQYCEPGMMFAGQWSTDRGDDFEMLLDGLTSDNIREAVGDEFDDRFNLTEMFAVWEQDCD